MGLAEIKNAYLTRKKEIKSRLKEFKENKDIFYELCFCILTPQSNAKKCWEARSILKQKNFLSNELSIAELEEILKTRTRFYRNKASYLLAARNNFADVKKQLSNDSFKDRELFVKNIKGISYKESSHFLRNIGYENLAILDRHILKNLHANGIIEVQLKTLTRKKYLEIEKKFINFSERINIPMDELDLLFWSIETGEVFR